MPSRPFRAALFGAATALLIGGLWIFLSGISARVVAFDCASLGAAECALEREIRARAARFQLVAGAGLTLLGFGALLWQRSADRRQGSRSSTTPE